MGKVSKEKATAVQNNWPESMSENLVLLAYF